MDEKKKDTLSLIGAVIVSLVSCGSILFWTWDSLIIRINAFYETFNSVRFLLIFVFLIVLRFYFFLLRFTSNKLSEDYDRMPKRSRRLLMFCFFLPIGCLFYSAFILGWISWLLNYDTISYILASSAI